MKRELIRTQTDKNGDDILVFRCENKQGEWWIEYEVKSIKLV
jgi:hypothetical protein